MFDPLESEQIEAYFQRLSKQLSKMPLNRRDEQVQELRQHLRSLLQSSANETDPTEAVSTALRRLGDPVQIGRKLMRQWKLSVGQTSAGLWRTLLIVSGWQIVFTAALYGAELLAHRYYCSSTGCADGSVGLIIIHSLDKCMFVIPLLAGVLVGARMPQQGVSAGFVSGVLYALGRAMLLLPFLLKDHLTPFPEFRDVGIECFAAYAASSIKLRDWKLRLF